MRCTLRGVIADEKTRRRKPSRHTATQGPADTRARVGNARSRAVVRVVDTVLNVERRRADWSVSVRYVGDWREECRVLWTAQRRIKESLAR